jgi:hypothetical protein
MNDLKFKIGDIICDSYDGSLYYIRGFTPRAGSGSGEYNIVFIVSNSIGMVNSCNYDHLVVGGTAYEESFLVLRIGK